MNGGVYGDGVVSGCICPNRFLKRNEKLIPNIKHLVHMWEYDQLQKKNIVFSWFF